MLHARYTLWRVAPTLIDPVVVTLCLPVLTGRAFFCLEKLCHAFKPSLDGIRLPRRQQTARHL